MGIVLYLRLEFNAGELFFTIYNLAKKIRPRPIHM